MKKVILRIRILLTNISRVIMSFLFINLNFSYVNKVFGVSTAPRVQVTCYAAGPQENDTLALSNVLIFLVPVIIVIGTIVLIVKKKKNNAKEENKDDKKD